MDAEIGYRNMAVKGGGLRHITPEMLDCVEGQVKALLHAERDCLRNQDKDTENIAFDCNNGYHGEAFGIMRALEIQGFGRFESSNLDGIHHGFDQPEQNLRYWFSQLEQEVLAEEGFRGDGHCAYCFERWNKDDRSRKEKRQSMSDDERAQAKGFEDYAALKATYDG